MCSLVEFKLVLVTGQWQNIKLRPARTRSRVTSQQTSTCEHMEQWLFAEISVFWEENVDFTPSFVLLEQPATPIQRVGILLAAHPNGIEILENYWSNRESTKNCVQFFIYKTNAAIRSARRDAARDDRIFLVVTSDGHVILHDRFGNFLWVGRIGLTKVLFLVLKMR